MEADYEDNWQHPEMKRWIGHVIDEMVPKMERSSVIISLCPPKGEWGDGDIKFWVELGAAIMMDKPIIGVVLNDRPVPRKLALVADEIVRLEDGVDGPGSEKLADALKRITER